MRELFSCALDGQPLHQLDDAIILLDIQEHPAEAAAHTFFPAGGGARFFGSKRRTLSVSLLLEIHEYDPPRRKHLCQEINRWAMTGRVLTITDRPGQQLCVRCTTPLVIPSALRWTQSLKLTFAAYERPYWEDETPTFIRWAAAKQQHEGALFLPGTAEKAPAEAEIIPAQGGSGDVTVRVGDTVITLAGLTLTAGQAVRIGYDASGLMEIRNGGVSVMKSRTGESSDELLAVPGQSSAISITAPVPVTAVVSARGCWV